MTAEPDPEVVQKVAAAVKAVAEAHGGAPPAAALAAAAMMAAAAATKRPSEAGAGPAAPAAVANGNLMQAEMGGPAGKATHQHDVDDLLHAQFGV